jgi:predicted phage tail protein
MTSTKYPADSEEAAVLTVVQSLLDAVPARDLKTLLAPTVPNGGAQTIHNDEFEAQTIQSLCEQLIAIPGDLEEYFIDPEVMIDRTGQLAMVWARNEITMDGKVIIEGTNAMSLHKIGGSWKISSISDVSRPVEGKKEDVTQMYEGGKKIGDA